jgi:hypothetical protein
LVEALALRLCSYEKGYLQALKDFRRHLKEIINSGGVQQH